MRRESLPVEALPAWARLNGVALSGVTFRQLQAEDRTDKGYAIVATEEKGTVQGPSEGEDSQPEVLLQIPSDLILSLEAVDNYAKADRYLREVLEAVGDLGRTARGAILIFLLIQLTYSSPDFANESKRIGVSSPWTEYVKFMPSSILLPTFYTDEELELLRGTSLSAPVDAKITALEREFSHLKQSTDKISWCQKYWWNEETGRLTLDDWKYVDAVYRSRMVDLPGWGDSVVPCIDMANHASEDTVKALYEKDDEGNAILQLRAGKKLSAGEEVTISYGDDKPALEMIFSYGFLEKERTEAKQLLLDLDIPDDDPLKVPKKVYCEETPAIQIDAPTSEGTKWDSPLVWWACVNEEDGLDFKLEQTTDGKKELRATWREEYLEKPRDLRFRLATDPLWDVIHLRAIVLILERLESQLLALRATEKAVSEIRREEEEDMLQATFRPGMFHMVSQLQEIEGELLEVIIEEFALLRQRLLSSEAVISYLSQQAGEIFIEEDYS